MTRSDSSQRASANYRTIWRWHFYAGLFVLPFIIVLSVTGSIYLFKPQIDRWEERGFRGLETVNVVSADRQREAALAANPGARFNGYRLPEEPGDAAMIRLGLADGGERQVFVSPQGRVLGSFDPETRISATVSRIHGSLLLGKWGDWLVELVASWTIVMILTGLYLWWPRPFCCAGTFWPRLSLKGRPLLKDIHRVTGFWIAGLVLIMLASGLPWAGVWGSAFKWVRTELGLVNGPQSWKIGALDGHAAHGHGAMPMPLSSSDEQHVQSLPLADFVAKARAEHMVFLVFVIPSHTPQQFGPPTGQGWTVKSETQNRTLQRQVTYDPASGIETGRRDFADQHIVDRVVNTGVAWHEGQLFGWINQLIGLMTAIALMAISILGGFMWLKRRPRNTVGVPPSVGRAQMRWAAIALVLLGLALPLFGASLVVLVILDRIISRALSGSIATS